MTDPEHPIWQILQMVTYLGAAMLFMWLNASSFDETEIKTLTELAAVVFGGEWLKAKCTRRNGR